MPERLKTSVKLVLWMIVKRVARRLANLQQSLDGTRSVVLPLKMGVVTTKPADAADARAAESLSEPTDVPVDDKEISRDTGMRRVAETPASSTATVNLSAADSSLPAANADTADTADRPDGAKAPADEALSLPVVFV